MARIFCDGDYSAPIRRFRCPIFHASARTAATSLGRFLHGPKSMANKKREDLGEFKRHLAMLSVPGVEGVYKTAYNDCSVSDFLLTAWMAVTGLGHCQRHSGGRFEKVPHGSDPSKCETLAQSLKTAVPCSSMSRSQPRADLL